MANENCEGCSGEGVLVGDAVGHRGERIDDVQPCPDCTSDDFDDYEHMSPASRRLAYKHWRNTSLGGALLRSMEAR
jgi:hypothetical protein